MSQHSRNGRNANSGIVVGLALSDWLHSLLGLGIPGRGGVSRHWEARAFALGGKQLSRPPTKELVIFLGKQTVGKQNNSKQTTTTDKRNVWVETQAQGKTITSALFTTLL